MTSTADSFSVRPYVREDEVRLSDLVRRIWAHKHDVDRQFRERWWWQWEQPPLYMVEDAGGAPIGVCAYIPFSLRACGVDLSAAWFVDFYVLSEYQGRGLGKRLTQVVQDRFQVTASLSQTAMAWRVFEKMGWCERTRVKLYVNRFPMRWMFRKPSSGFDVSRCTLDAGSPVAADLDALWTRVRDSYRCIARRDGAELLRRYARRGMEYVLLCGRRGGECAGYMIVRVVRGTSGGKPSQGLIVDYLVHPDDTGAFTALLSEASSVLLDDGAERIYCISTSPRIERALVSRGFLSPTTPVIGRALRANNKWLTYYSKTKPDPVDPAAWFLTMGDCDIDYAWYQS